jgi:hypothetical protein
MNTSELMRHIDANQFMRSGSQYDSFDRGYRGVQENPISTWGIVSVFLAKMTK